MDKIISSLTLDDLLIQLAEEAAELAQAATKYYRVTHVGDTAYEVDIISNRVNRFVIKDLYHLGRLIDDECFGTLVFLAREEAEAAMAKRRRTQ